MTRGWYAALLIAAVSVGAGAVQWAMAGTYRVTRPRLGVGVAGAVLMVVAFVAFALFLASGEAP